MKRNWKDKRNKTSFKSIFCILTTELVYNQDNNVPHHAKKIYPYIQNKICTHTLGRAHTLIHKRIKMPGVSNIRKLNTVRFKAENICYIQYGNVEQRERQRQRDKETDSQRQRRRKRQTDKQTDTQRQREASGVYARARTRVGLDIHLIKPHRTVCHNYVTGI